MSRRVVSDRVKHADLVQHELVFLKYFRSREESGSSVVTWETSYNQQRNQKTSQFGPVRIRTFTALHNSVVERLPLRTETNNQKKILCTTLLTWTTVIPHCVTECSTPISAPGSKDPLLTVSFTGPDRMHMLCVLKASGGSKAGTKHPHNNSKNPL